MVKSKNLSSFNLLESIYKFDLLKANFSLKNLGIYSIVMLVLISIVNYFKYSSSTLLSFTGLQAMLYTLFLLPVLFLFFHSIFHSFVVSFAKDNKKKFWESYFNLSVVLLPFIFLGHILTTIPLYIVSYTLSQIIMIVLSVMIIYAIFNVIFNMKNYYNVSGYISFSSFLLTYLAIMTVVILEYLTLVLSQVK